MKTTSGRLTDLNRDLKRINPPPSTLVPRFWHPRAQQPPPVPPTPVPSRHLLTKKQRSRLRSIRLAESLLGRRTRDGIAKALDLHKSHVCYIFAGQRQPSTTVLRSLAEHLGLTMGQLDSRLLKIRQARSDELVEDAAATAPVAK